MALDSMKVLATQTQASTDLKFRLRERLRRHAPQKLRRAWLFGSFARGDANSASDVDILFEAAPPLSLLEASRLKITNGDAKTCGNLDYFKSIEN